MNKTKKSMVALMIAGLSLSAITTISNNEVIKTNNDVSPLVQDYNYKFVYDFNINSAVDEKLDPDHADTKWSDLIKFIGFTTAGSIIQNDDGTYSAIDGDSMFGRDSVGVEEFDNATDDDPIHQQLTSYLEIDPSRADKNGNVQLHTYVNWHFSDTLDVDNLPIGFPPPKWDWYENGLPYSDFTININENTLMDNTAYSRDTSYFNGRISDIDLNVWDSDGNYVYPNDNSSEWTIPDPVSESGMKTGLIVGISIIGIITAVVIIGVSAFLISKSKKN